jgi:hypothetical protein
MLAPSALFRGLVSRLLPSPNADSQNVDVTSRFGRYGENYVLSLVRKQHALADEGSYFVTHNAQTGVLTSMLGTSFSQTTLSPYLFLLNTETAGGKSIYLDYLNLICTVVGAFASAGTKLLFAWSTDSAGAARYASGGTELLTGAASNGGSKNVRSGAAQASALRAVIGALTLNTPVSSRLIVPQRIFRVTNSATVAGAVEDEARMNFGGVEHAAPSALLDLTTAKTVGYREHHQLPPIVIDPGHAAILHLWSPGQAVSTTAITYLPELGHWER